MFQEENPISPEATAQLQDGVKEGCCWDHAVTGRKKFCGGNKPHAESVANFKVWK